MRGWQWYRATKNISRQKIAKKRCQRESARPKPPEDEHPIAKASDDWPSVWQAGPAADPRTERSGVRSEGCAEGTGKKPQIMIMTGANGRRVNLHRRIAPEGGAKIVPAVQRRCQIAAKTDAPVETGHDIVRWHLADKALCDLQRQFGITGCQQPRQIRSGGNDNGIGADLPAVRGVKFHSIRAGDKPVHRKSKDRVQIAKEIRQQPVRPDRPRHLVMNGFLT